MTIALKLCFGIVMWFAAVQGDVSHLGYSRFRGQRLRLQRLEAEPAPYPAAGFRPNREFSLPRDQPLFPLANQHNSRPFGSSGFDNLGETQRPQLTYGSPQPEPRFRPQNRPQKFNNVDEPQEPVFVVQYETGQTSQRGNNNFERPQQPQSFNNGFNNNFAGDQPDELENQQPQNGFNNLAEPQQPDSLYGAPNNQEQEAQSARLRQQLFARLQQAQRLEQQQQQQQQQAESQRYRQTHSLKLKSPHQQLLNTPQTLYTAPHQQTQLPAESQTSRLLVQKPARLTDNREETDLEADAKTAETEEIETTTKAEDKKVTPQTAIVAAANPNGAAQNGIVTYYPAGAVSFVQPFNAAYLASANYQTLQPVSAANYQTLQPVSAVGSPYLPQQYALAAAPAAQLQAW